MPPEIGFRAYPQAKAKQICQNDIALCSRVSVVLGHFAAFWSVLGTAFRNARTASNQRLVQLLRNFHQLTAFEQAELILHSVLDTGCCERDQEGRLCYISGAC
jgi:hypothetical protein